MKIVVTALLLATFTDQSPLMRYEDLVESQTGRELLIKSLVEKQNERFANSRSRVVLSLPPSLGGSLIETRESSAPCCSLKEVQFKYRNGVYTTEIIKKVLEMTGVDEHSKEAFVDHSDELVKKSIEIVADIINGDERPFDDMLSLAAAIKDLVNEDIYEKAILIVAQRRTDIDQSNIAKDDSDDDLNYEPFDDYFKEVFTIRISDEEGIDIFDTEQLIKEREKNLAEKELILAEKERILKEKEKLLNQREKLLGKRQMLLDERVAG
eukprot:TRINITY_DN6928_c0_g1_i5.p1 TRINITY_DN6928_c0_g1~~TRINITY_DN6928_c0_g1_i5.p1  ORF type:complete len:267 (-),score=66.84 TRINITY_DN6928_c0_g1_i5:319-1119(-)